MCRSLTSALDVFDALLQKIRYLTLLNFDQCCQVNTVHTLDRFPESRRERERERERERVSYHAV